MAKCSSAYFESWTGKAVEIVTRFVLKLVSSVVTKDQNHLAGPGSGQ